MLAGELYRRGDDEIQAEQHANKAWLARYNTAMALPVAERHGLLSAHFGRAGADAVIRPPFFCDFGYNIFLGDGVFLNFNCVILDVVHVVIGDRTQIARPLRFMPPTIPGMPGHGATGLSSVAR